MSQFAAGLYGVLLAGRCKNDIAPRPFAGEKSKPPYDKQTTVAAKALALPRRPTWLLARRGRGGKRDLLLFTDGQADGAIFGARDKPSVRGRLPNAVEYRTSFGVVGVIAWSPSPFTPGRARAAAHTAPVAVIVRCCDSARPPSRRNAAVYYARRRK